MLLRSFKSGKLALLLVIPVLAGLMWLKYFILPQPVEMSFEPNAMPFYDWFLGQLENHPLLSRILTLLLLIFIGMWVSRMNTKFIILQHRTYLPAIIYIVLVSSYQPLQVLNPAVFAAAFFVLSLDVMLDAYKKEGLAHEFFMAGFLIAIASLFYARAAFLMLIVWTGLAILRPVQWREWVFTVLGFAVPIIFLFASYYLSGVDSAASWELIRQDFIHDRTAEIPNYIYLAFYGYVLILILLASRKMLYDFQKLKIYIRKFFRLNFWIFAFVLAIFLIIYSRAMEMIYFLAIPVSYILSYYFFNTRSRLRGEIIFTLFLAGYVVIIIFN